MFHNTPDLFGVNFTILLDFSTTIWQFGATSRHAVSQETHAPAANERIGLVGIVGEVVGIVAERSGLPRLRFFVEISSRENWSGTLLSLTAYVQLGRVTWKEDNAPFIGFAGVEWHGTLSSAGTRFSILLTVSHQQLQILEDYRDGRDLYFFLTISYVIGTVSSDQQQRQTYITGAVEGKHNSASFITHKVAKSDWLKFLKELGWGEYFLIEVPLRAVMPRTAFKQALQHLSEAWDHFAERRDAETLTSCYKAFEHLAKVKGCERPDQQAFERLLAGADDPSKQKRLAILMKELCQYLHFGRHEPGAERPPVDGRDSEYALILTQASLALLAKLVPRSSPSSAIARGRAAPQRSRQRNKRVIEGGLHEPDRV